MKRPVVWLSASVVLASLGSPRAARSSDPPPPSPPSETPDESLLGTVEVNGSAGGLPPLPQMASPTASSTW
jgi:hypothetical protein